MEHPPRSALSRTGVLLGLFLLIVTGCGGGGSDSASGISIANAPTSGVAATPASPSGENLGGQGVAALAWTPPTTRMDGSALTDLAGYKIHYGTEQGQYTEIVDVPGAGISEYVLVGLGPGTYYFVVTAYDEAGGESPPSNETMKTI